MIGPPFLDHLSSPLLQQFYLIIELRLLTRLGTSPQSSPFVLKRRKRLRRQAVLPDDEFSGEIGEELMDEEN